MKRIDLENGFVDENIRDSELLEFYRNGKFIGRFRLDRPEAIIELNIKDILNSENRYFVSAYQRGYRWTPQQVNELLDDIWSWDENAKYSLQPIVIKQLDDGRIELVDGQQRLTTLYIILSAAGWNQSKIGYDIDYETRKGTTGFLKSSLKDESESSKNIDWYHMHQAYKVAEKYFDVTSKEEWVKKLTNSEKGAFFVQYQILKEIDGRPVEQIFTGLNAGKIPLTNSELVKSLILREDNFKTETYQNEFVEIAEEWDRIERRLRESNFWAWLGQDVTNDNPHIDYILEIIADRINRDEKYELQRKSYQEFYSYNVIRRYLNDKKKLVDENNQNSKGYPVTDFWRMIKQCFMTFEDWYSDNESYHLTGYISITKNEKIDELYRDHLSSDTLNLKEYISRMDIDNLSYGDKGVQNTLLLFNVVTCIRTKSRFRFDDYVKVKYHVEHISPHSGFDDIKNKKERLDWIKAIRDSSLEKFNELFVASDFEGAEIISDDADKFESFYKKVIERTESEPWRQEEKLDQIGNLCLLDSKTNEEYGNKPFPLKVKKIVEVDKLQGSLDKNGEIEPRYLLPTTKNAFLKYYSGVNVNNLTWDESDAKAYRDEIACTLSDYFGWEEISDEK